ncbi:MAG: TA system VapC family ribonuclease toxin [Pyrinomonadaceae bacterium]
MILFDANILLYAYIEELPQHRHIAKWVEGLFARQTESIALTWIVLNAFLRISTSKRIFGRPWKIADAAERIDQLLAHPMTLVVGPSDDHWKTYNRILSEVRVTGNLVMDAHIAAIAAEQNASVASADKDFRKFSDFVKIVDPLAK